MAIKIKRAYEPPESSDGFRILVDRLWPRGVSKESAQINLWMKDIAPSNELRSWFGHDPTKWNEFRKRYIKELDKNKELLKQLESHAAKGVLTLVYAARDKAHNNAAVIKDRLESEGI